MNDWIAPWVRVALAGHDGLTYKSADTKTRVSAGPTLNVAIPGSPVVSASVNEASGGVG